MARQGVGVVALGTAVAREKLVFGMSELSEHLRRKAPRLRVIT